MTGYASYLPSLRDLLPAPVVVGSMPVAPLVGSLPDAERSLVSRAVCSRQQEFATGRVLARDLLRRLDVRVESIGRRADRTPIWPAGIVGSISHCHDLCVAAVGRESDGIRSLGLDVEPVRPLPEEMWATVAGHAERTVVDSARISPGMRMIRLFSAKEAYFKCFYPVHQRILDFHEVEITFNQDYDRFDGQATIASRTVSGAIEGRQGVMDRWILTAAFMYG